MQIGMIGLGRMGANLVRRLERDGHECVVYDVSPAAVAALAADGATPAASISEFVSKLTAPRAVWVMVPAAFAASTVHDVAAHLEPGDTIIDGGNSNYADAIAHAAALAPQGLHFLDIGTSGGVYGLERDYCLMIGGPTVAVDRLAPIFDTLAPGVETAQRTPGRTGPPTTAERGWLHCGPSGAGHFVKMVHNGIEYGMMAAYAEGLSILRGANVGSAAHAIDAETTPMRDAEHYRYDMALRDIAEVWRRGSVVSSWLLDLTAAALQVDPKLANFGGRVSDSGEGRWTIKAAIDEAVPVPVLTAALFARFSSRGEAEFQNRVLSAMRFQFGGHVEKPGVGQ